MYLKVYDKTFELVCFSAKTHFEFLRKINILTFGTHAFKIVIYM